MATRFINPATISKPAGISVFCRPRKRACGAGYTHVVEITGPGKTIYIAGQLGDHRR